MKPAQPKAKGVNLQLTNGLWINTHKLSDAQYQEALRRGILNMILLGEIDPKGLDGIPEKSGLL